MKRVILIIVGLVVCLEGSFLAQQERPKVTIKPVAEPVYMLQGDGGNIGVMADASGLFMVDAMMESATEGVRMAIKSLSGGDRVRVLVNTHWHLDHVEENKSLASGALIITHEHSFPLKRLPLPLIPPANNPPRIHPPKRQGCRAIVRISYAPDVEDMHPALFGRQRL